MNSTAGETNRSRGWFSVESTVPRAAEPAFDTYQRKWQTQIGDDFPLPTFSRATTGNFLGKLRVARVRDLVITDGHSSSAVRTAGAVGGVEDQVRMWVVDRGAWTVGAPHDREQHTVSAGQFLLRHVGAPSHFHTAPHTTATVVVLPAAMLKPLLGGRVLTGPVDSAEVRLLMAHTKMIHATMADLGPAGVEAAHSTVVELAKAVARGRFDDAEPQLAPALVQAAMDLADRRLADRELSAAMLARELNVSVRTLQRAFAAADESVTAYIRRRRLEEARLALATPSNRMSVSELAAYWQFADSSHFGRAFKKQYGSTPTEYVRQQASRKP
jgi:AraC family transcriptional activator of tynA and feaB